MKKQLYSIFLFLPDVFRNILTVFGVVLFSIVATNAQAPFVTVWDTEQTPDGFPYGTDKQVHFYGVGSGYTISWEELDNPDNNGSLLGYNATIIDFPYSGTYRVSVTPGNGTFHRVKIGVSGEQQKLLKVEAWGDIVWRSMEYAFTNCKNLEIIATDIPNLTNVKSMKFMFERCHKLNGPSNINFWNTSSVKDMSEMFQQAYAFNKDIGSWDVSNVMFMNGMFNNAHAFDQDIGTWNTENVVDMRGMFSFARNFNQDIGNWNTSKVTHMGSMFRSTERFNQNLADWDVSQVSDMNWMFESAINFNQSFETWNLNPSVFLHTFIRNSGVDCENYDNTLIAWSENPSIPSGISLLADGLRYYLSNDARTSLINNKNWTISGDLYENCSENCLPICQNQTVCIHQGNMRLLANPEGGMFSGPGVIADYIDPNIAGIGTHTITYTYQGVYGCEDQCTFDVSILDCVNTLEENKFITVWNTELGPASIYTNTQIFFPGTGQNYQIEWNLLSDPLIKGFLTATNAVSLNLPFKGIYALKVSPGNGNFTRFNMDNNSGMRSRLIDIAQWGAINWSSMQTAFFGCSFLDISALDIPNLSGVTNMESMFRNCWRLNGPDNINLWNTSNVTNMNRTFEEARIFNQPLENWNTENVTTMGVMFGGARLFNQPIGNWNTGNVTSMGSMFSGAIQFNQPIGNWNTGKVTLMSGMFWNASAFNQDIGNWNTENVTSMSTMFRNATNFDQDIGNWNTSKVVFMIETFKGSPSFNQNIGNWNVQNVVSMNRMFQNASVFNQDISTWNINKVFEMPDMFDGAVSFNHDLANWNLRSQGVNMMGLFNNSGMDCENYDSTISGWSNYQNVPSNISLGALSLSYFNAEQDRQFLISNKNWTFNGDIYQICDECEADCEDITVCIYEGDFVLSATPAGGVFSGTGVSDGIFDPVIAGLGTHTILYEYEGPYDCESSCEFEIEVVTCTVIPELDKFITIWNTEFFGQSQNNQIIFPGVGTDYRIEWSLIANPLIKGIATGNNTTTLSFPIPGVYKIKVHPANGNFDRINFYNNPGDKNKLISINQWGTINWSTMERAFYGCDQMQYHAHDVPNFENVSSIKEMFKETYSALLIGTGSLTEWDISNVNNLSGLFSRSSFDDDIGSWNTANVSDMSFTFNEAYLFNKELSNWNTSNVTNMMGMFGGTASFNQNIGNWDVGQVTLMGGDNFEYSRTGMFDGAWAFNQDISGWDVSNVTNMRNMFREAIRFNQDIGGWDVSNVTNMYRMFLSPNSSSRLAFNQNLGGWQLHPVVNLQEMFQNTSMSCSNYDATLIGWSQLSPPIVARTLGASGLTYWQGVDARNILVNNRNWTINGDSYDVCDYCIVVCPLDFHVCVEDESFPLEGGTPVGGDYSGPGIIDNVFYPHVAGEGAHIVNYTTSCDLTCQFTIVVDESEEASCPPDITLEINDAPVELTQGLPEGGEFSGDGVIDGTFYPQIAGEGVHIIEYFFESGCVESCVFNVTVECVVQCPQDISICIDDDSIILEGGMPEGGAYSGPGVVDGVFYPDLAGVGTHLIEYQVNCLNDCDFTIVVTDIPVVDCPTDISVFTSDPPFSLQGATPTGGEYTGPGVTNGEFDPAAAGIGTHEITYTYQNADECVSACTFTVTVTSPATFLINTSGDEINVYYNTDTGPWLVLRQYSGTNLGFTSNISGRTYSLNGGPTLNMPLSLPQGSYNHIVVHGSTGNDIINFSQITDPFPGITIHGSGGNDRVQFSTNITFLNDADLIVDLQQGGVGTDDEILFDVNRQINLTGAGSAVLKAGKTVDFGGSSQLRTENGAIIAEGNWDNSAVSGFVNGVNLQNNSLIQVQGSGNILLKGKGGLSSGNGVSIIGLIVGGGAGHQISVEGEGIMSAASNIRGVLIDGSNRGISAAGADVNVIGSIMGTGSGSNNIGVMITNGGIIQTASGNGNIVVTGSGGDGTTISDNHGVQVGGTGSLIRTSGSGNIIINGTGGANGTKGLGFRLGTGASVNTTTGGGNISLYANNMEILATIQTPANNFIKVQPMDEDIEIALGLNPWPINGQLKLNQTALDNIVTQNLTVGSETSGDLFLKNDLNRSSNTSFDLKSGKNIIIENGLLSVGSGNILLSPGDNYAVLPQNGGTNIVTNNISGTLIHGGPLKLVINGTFPDTEYTRLSVNGNVNLNSVDLVLSGLHIPQSGQSFVIVNNEGTNAIIGQFNNLPEGAIITNFINSSFDAEISYVGGDGNDVEITLVAGCPPVLCPDDMQVCISDETFSLIGGTPSDGVYSGTGVTSNSFDPVLAGVGQHTITYSYNDGVGCDISCTFLIEVFDLPVVNCPDDLTICLEFPGFQITDISPSGGDFSGDGIDVNGIFTAAEAGIGIHSISYTYTDTNTNCINTCNFNIEVTSQYPCILNVINTDDTGTGSLRDMIGVANQMSGRKIIAFDIPGAGPHVIMPLTSYPQITADSITIDGSTQTDNFPMDGQIVIDISSIPVTNKVGMTIIGKFNEIYGLSFKNYTLTGGSNAIYYNTTATDFILGDSARGNWFLEDRWTAAVFLKENLYRGIIQSNLFKSDSLAMQTAIVINSGDWYIEIGGDSSWMKNYFYDCTNEAILLRNSSDYNTIVNNDFIGNNIAIYNNANTFSGNNRSNIYRNNLFECNQIDIEHSINANQNILPPVIEYSKVNLVSGTALPGAFVDLYITLDTCTVGECKTKMFSTTVQANELGEFYFAFPHDNLLLNGSKIVLQQTDTLLQGSSEFSNCFIIDSTCVEFVYSCEDNIVGSLRSAIECVNPGNEVIFLYFLNGESLILEDSLIIDKDVKINGLGSQQLSLLSVADDFAIKVIQDVNTEIMNLELQLYNDYTGSPVINEGNLILQDVIIRDIRPVASDESVKNRDNGILTIRNTVEIIK